MEPPRLDEPHIDDRDLGHADTDLGHGRELADLHRRPREGRCGHFHRAQRRRHERPADPPSHRLQHCAHLVQSREIPQRLTLPLHIHLHADCASGPEVVVHFHHRLRHTLLQLRLGLQRGIRRVRQGVPDPVGRRDLPLSVVPWQRRLRGRVQRCARGRLNPHLHVRLDYHDLACEPLLRDPCPGDREHQVGRRCEAGEEDGAIQGPLEGVLGRDERFAPLGVPLPHMLPGPVLTDHDPAEEACGEGEGAR
mmetsp:Transcript_22057/g.63095  ORF Transcript_22057/g.63095 Transcript_22057/m.63095 type:complete len:251 (+) Transcript_22057:1159-1911(+)